MPLGGVMRIRLLGCAVYVLAATGVAYGDNSTTAGGCPSLRIRIQNQSSKTISGTLAGVNGQTQAIAWTVRAGDASTRDLVVQPERGSYMVEAQIDRYGGQPISLICGTSMRIVPSCPKTNPDAVVALTDRSGSLGCTIKPM